MARLQSLFQDIEDFHHKFGLEYKGKARNLPADLEKFRTMFLGEELAEYITVNPIDHRFITDAVDSCLEDTVRPPLEKQFDALIDLVYVALGTAYLQGFDFDEGWRRVHECNMKKVRALKASDSARGSTQDVVKPKGWTPPVLTDLVS